MRTRDSDAHDGLGGREHAPTPVRVFAPRFVLVLALALVAPPAGAQDAVPLDRRVAQLEAENAVLKIEVRALRDRIEALEEIVRTRLGTAPVSADAHAPAAAPPAAAATAGDLGMGARSPEDLVRLLHHHLATAKDPAKAVADVMAELAAFGHVDPLFAPETWERAKPRGFAGTPSRDLLQAALRALAPDLVGSRLAWTKAWRNPGGSAEIDFGVASDAGPIGMRATALEIDGRWLLVHLFTERFAASAMACLREIARLEEAIAAADPVRRAPGSFDELDARATSPSFLLASYEGARPFPVERLDARTLRIPFYRIELQPLARGEWGAVAIPEAPGYPRLVIGPLPSDHDPLKDPYEVRVSTLTASAPGGSTAGWPPEIAAIVARYEQALEARDGGAFVKCFAPGEAESEAQTRFGARFQDDALAFEVEPVACDAKGLRAVVRLTIVEAGVRRPAIEQVLTLAREGDLLKIARVEESGGAK